MEFCDTLSPCLQSLNQATTWAATPLPLAPRELQVETERVRNTCVFCPGNEAMTMEEVMRVTYGEIYDSTSIPLWLPRR